MKYGSDDHIQIWLKYHQLRSTDVGRANVANSSGWVVRCFRVFSWVPVTCSLLSLGTRVCCLFHCGTLLFFQFLERPSGNRVSNWEEESSSYCAGLSAYRHTIRLLFCPALFFSFYIPRIQMHLRVVPAYRFFGGVFCWLTFAAEERRCRCRSMKTWQCTGITYPYQSVGWRLLKPSTLGWDAVPRESWLAQHLQEHQQSGKDDFKISYLFFLRAYSS